MPRRIIKSVRIRWALAIIAAFWATTFFVPTRVLALTLTLTLAALSFGVIVKYGRQVIVSVFEDDLGPVSQLATGILIGFTGLLIGLLWAIASRAVPGGDWMLSSPMVPFYLLLYNLAAALHITARRTGYGKVPPGDWAMLAFAIVGGLALAAIMVELEIVGIVRPPPPSSP